MRILDKYKPYLDAKTIEGSGINDDNLSRYHSFKFCIDFLKKIKNPEVLELGTCRSFVDGAYEGCNLDDIKYWDKDNYEKWDWGAGCFSLIFGQEISDIQLTSVDISQAHINRCKVMTDSLEINCNHVVLDSMFFLTITDKKYDLIYLDTGDMTPIEPTAQLQLSECIIIIKRNLLKEGGILLIDDVLNKTPAKFGETSGLGKSKYSIPYLLQNGFKEIFKGYQYIFQK